MKHLLPRLAMVLCLLLGTQRLAADSPLTSTYWANLYSADVKLIAKAETTHKVDKNIAKYLLGKASLGEKIALVNALGWNVDGQNNTGLMMPWLKKTYGVTPQTEADWNRIPADVCVVMGYMKAMDNYFEPFNGMMALESGAGRLKTSLAAQLVYALVKAQVYFDSDWCQVYQVVARVTEDESLEMDLKVGVEEAIMEYITLYKSEC